MSYFLCPNSPILCPKLPGPYLSLVCRTVSMTVLQQKDCSYSKNPGKKSTYKGGFLVLYICVNPSNFCSKKFLDLIYELLKDT